MNSRAFNISNINNDKDSDKQRLFAQGPIAELNQLIQLRHFASQLSKTTLRKTKSRLAGGHPSHIKGRGMDFDEVRLYQAGDDIRNIDWRVTARTSITHTKIFKEETEKPALLFIDQSPSLFFGSKITFKSVMACQIASLIAWQALKQNDKVGGIVFNHRHHQEIKPRRNKHAVLQLLKIACQYNQSLMTDIKDTESCYSLPQALGQLQRIAKPGSAVFIISDFINYSSEVEKCLYLIARHTRIHAIKIADPMEENLPRRQGWLSFSDGKNTQKINTKNKTLISQYQNNYQQHIENLSQSLNKIGIPLSIVKTNDSPLTAAQQILQR